jgi:glycosyltransferase involved in cell wall biosynthesis
MGLNEINRMLLSIITPSYRQVEYLRLCARSVADQRGSFTHEHLVQDGGSGEEFEAWEAGQGFARVCSEPDGGMYDAINRGFARAEGEILAWLNCDEQYLPGTLGKVAAWFEAHPDRDILFGDVILVSPEGAPLSYRQAVLPLRGHIRSCFLPTFSAATFVRRRVVEQGHRLDTRFRAIADAVWIDSLLGAGYRAGLLNEALAVFTQTGENLGQTRAAAAESEDWRRECGASAVWRRWFWSGVHRLRKSLRGAYGRREIEIAVHLPGTEGRTLTRGRAGGRWRVR